MTKAANYLGLPIVSGNVSFYNETNNINIPPTPQIGAVGVIDNYERTVSYNSYFDKDNIPEPFVNDFPNQLFIPDETVKKILINKSK